jgi:hypothetical protein
LKEQQQASSPILEVIQFGSLNDNKKRLFATFLGIFGETFKTGKWKSEIPNRSFSVFLTILLFF